MTTQPNKSLGDELQQPDELDEIIKPLIAKSRCGFCGNYKCPHITDAKQRLSKLINEAYEKGKRNGQASKRDKQPGELLIILCDYTNDLKDLKRRNGKLPAEAAVERLEAWRDNAVREAGIDELEGVKEHHISIPVPYEVGTGPYIEGRLVQLKGSTEGEE